MFAAELEIFIPTLKYSAKCFLFCFVLHLSSRLCTNIHYSGEMITSIDLFLFLYTTFGNLSRIWCSLSFRKHLILMCRFINYV